MYCCCSKNRWIGKYKQFLKNRSFLFELYSRLRLSLPDNKCDNDLGQFIRSQVRGTARAGQKTIKMSQMLLRFCWETYFNLSLSLSLSVQYFCLVSLFSINVSFYSISNVRIFLNVPRYGFVFENDTASMVWPHFCIADVSISNPI